MFSIYIICLVSFHYLRRRRVRRFYANRAGETKFPHPLFSLVSLRFVSFFLSSSSSSHLSFSLSLFLYERRALIVVVIIAIIIVIITIATTITIIILPAASVLE